MAVCKLVTSWFFYASSSSCCFTLCANLSSNADLRVANSPIYDFIWSWADSFFSMSSFSATNDCLSISMASLNCVESSSCICRSWFNVDTSAWSTEMRPSRSSIYAYSSFSLASRSLVSFPIYSDISAILLSFSEMAVCKDESLAPFCALRSNSIYSSVLILYFWSSINLRFISAVSLDYLRSIPIRASWDLSWSLSFCTAWNSLMSFSLSMPFCSSYLYCICCWATVSD